jgi:hypothetical protein
MEATTYLDGQLLTPEPTAGTVADWMQENFRHTLERTAGSDFPAHADLIPSINASPPTIELDCSDPTAVVADGMTLTADTTNWLRIGSADRPQAIKATPTSATSGRFPGFYWHFDPVKDLTNYGIIVDVYVYEGTYGQENSWYNVVSLNALITDEAGVYTNQVLMYCPGAVEAGELTEGHLTYMHPGWNRLFGLIGNKTTASFDQTTIHRFGLYWDRWLPVIEGKVVFAAARVTLVPPPSTPYWSLIFNPVLTPGGPQNTYKRLAYLATKGIRALVHVSPWRVGLANQLTLDQCKQIKRMGHHVSCYPEGADTTGWYLQTTAEKIANTRYCKAWLADNGLADGIAEHMMEPSGHGGSDWDHNTYAGKYIAAAQDLPTNNNTGYPLYGATTGWRHSMVHLDNSDGWGVWNGKSGYNGVKVAKGWTQFFSHVDDPNVATFDANLATLLSDTAAGTIKYISIPDAYLGRNL